MLRNLRKEFGVAVGAGESAIRIDTDEIDDATKTIQDVCKKLDWELRVFDVLVGTQWWNGEPEKKNTGPAVPLTMKNPGDMLNAVGNGPGGPQAPPSVIQVLMDFWNEPAKPDKVNRGEVRPVVLVVKNLHLGFDRNKEAMVALIQHLVVDKVHDHKQYPEKLKKELYDPNGIAHDSDTGKFVVGMMPAEAKLPPEVDPLFKKLTHELPDEDELAHILDGVAHSGKPDGDDEDNGSGLSDEDRKKVCKFALGLTRLQAEGVFGSCLVTHERIVPSYVWQAKSEILNKEGLVELYMGKEKFKDVAGLEGAKDFLKRLLTPDEYDDLDPDVRAKGVLFCGPPGVGKSLVAKATGNELGLPTLMVNPGNWMGQYVGESEAKTRKGFQILRAHAPCIAVVDEVEKVMPKSRGGGGDSGVSARMEGSFLTAMNDIQEQIFWVFTANDVKNMHEAFFRAERVDGVFYVKLPGPIQRAALWKLYGKKFFPREVTVNKQVIAFPAHIPLDVNDLIDELKKAKKVKPDDWANRFTLGLMCLPDEKRKAAIEKIKAANENVGSMLKPVDDDGWSPAEIRACCRLARRLKEPITKTQMRIRPVSVSASKAIENLEDWAAEAALDAETGELYMPPVVEDDDTGEAVDNRIKKTDKKKARRKVRRVND